MTNEEAIKSALDKVKKQKENFGFMDRFNVDENWEVMKALEKQIAKKPKRNNTIASKFFHKTSCYTCPTCGNGLLTKMMTERQDTRFCWDCGQRLDWSEGEANGEDS